MLPRPCTGRPQPGQPPPALHSPTLRAQDKAKLQFSGLIARMPVQGRDRDSFVPAPSASVPGEWLKTDLALCAQPWLDTARTSSWADKDKIRNSWRFWAVRYLLEQPSDTAAPVLFPSWAQIRKSSAALSGADNPEGSWAALPTQPGRKNLLRQRRGKGSSSSGTQGELGSSQSIHPCSSQVWPCSSSTCSA